MKQVRLMMGMPITIEICDPGVKIEDIDKVFNYFQYIDNTFSTYKQTSEISAINNGKVKRSNYSSDMRTVLRLCEITKKATRGYFDIEKNGYLDPSGLVKGWSIHKASQLIRSEGYTNYYIEAGGDIEMSGVNMQERKWSVGIRNPFNKDEIIKVLELTDKGIATSGLYERGEHLYNPKTKEPANEISSMTVIGPDVYEADRFATAAFVMGKSGVGFIESLNGFEAYSIDKSGIATYTSGFEKYVKNN